MEAEGIEPSSQDVFDEGLYMLRRVFTAAGTRRVSSLRASTVTLSSGSAVCVSSLHQRPSEGTSSLFSPMKLRANSI